MQQDAPIPALGSSRLNTDFTFRPRPQNKDLQYVQRSKSPSRGPPDGRVEHMEAARPEAAPAISGGHRIYRQANSQKQLQDVLKRAAGVEAAQVQVRRQRELDHLVRASTSHARTNHVKDNSHEPRLQQQDSGQKKIFAAKSAASRAGDDTATWMESQVKPLPEIQQSARTVRDAITVAANHPRPAAAVSISTTPTRETTPDTQLPESSLAQSPPRVPKTTDTYRPSVPRNEARGSGLARDGGYISKTPSPGPPPQARLRAPSSMEEDSLAAAPWELPQYQHISRADGSNEPRTPPRSQTGDRDRESSIPGIEALNLGDRSSLASTTSEKSVRDRSPIPAGEVDPDYLPSSSSSPVSLQGEDGEEEPEAPVIRAFGPDSQPATPTSSRNTSDVFSPFEPTASHMSLLSSPGGSDTSRRPPSDGNSTPTAGRPRQGTRLRFLDRYLHAIFDQETWGGADFLARQGKVYREVIGTFFDVECKCIHSMRETVTHPQRLFPPLSEIFGPSGSYDPTSYFHLWQRILSDQPALPLSLRKSEAFLARFPITIRGLFDIDSACLHISTDQVVQPHRLSLERTRHVLGSFQTGPVRFSAFVLFPSSADSPRSKMSASSNTLSHERLQEFYDEIIFPAIREAIKDPFHQEIPQSFYMDLARFWSLVVEKANLLRIPTKQGENVAYFKNPRLLFQAHDLKNTFARPRLHETFSSFGDTVLAGLDPDQLDMRSCWIDIGARYYADGPGVRQRGGTEPITLFWKSQCNRHLHESLVKIAPGSPLSATHFRSFLLRDTGNVMFKTIRSRTVDAGHPDSRQPGIIRAKAYNNNKRIFGRESTLHAWEANKRHVNAISGPETVMNYGVRKELTFCLSALLKEWSDSSFDTGRNAHTGPFSRVLPLGPDSDVHCPFWMLPTRDLNDLIFTQAARLLLPLDHLFQEASLSGSDQAMLCN
ncbi:hypothetical protein X797_011645 [Metarhizium robertsii]|uniref:Uncharacterized protein n=1 Tax=Metarhizium robertsii TaxID=568076 RepID=A0A014P1X6_9HYPO|nr:hypothetical protein X797_011645 [Metarhizium robertsii]